MKNNGIWLKLAAGFQLMTGLLHSLSFFNDPKGSNEKEETLIELMNGLQIDMGAGYIRTMSDLMNALSIGYMLLFLFAGILNVYLIRKAPPKAFIHGMLLIELTVFSGSFVAMLFFAFLPPIVLNGLVVICLGLAVMANKP